MRCHLLFYFVFCKQFQLEILSKLLQRIYVQFSLRSVDQMTVACFIITI